MADGIYSDYTGETMIRYSGYTTGAVLPGIVMFLDLSQIVSGQYIDIANDIFHADAVTINTANDGIRLANAEYLQDKLKVFGLFDKFYEADGTPKSVLLSQLGYVYNNCLFRNSASMLLTTDWLTGIALEGVMDNFFGAFDADALSLITAIGVTSELQKRLIDLHVKDLKVINETSANFFKYGDPVNSTLKVLYPMVGETFDELKLNWVNPEDSNAGNRLSLEEGNPVRVLRNAIDFFGTFCLNTHFNASTSLASTHSYSYYSLFDQTDSYFMSPKYLPSITYNENRFEMGCLGQSAGYKGISFSIRRDNVSHSICESTYQSPTKGVQYAETNSANYYLTNKLTNTDLKQYRQGVQIGSTVSDSGVSSYYNGDIILGGYSIDGVIQTEKHSVLPCGYFHLGGAIPVAVLTQFTDAVIRLCDSKNYYYFYPEETAKV